MDIQEIIIGCVRQHLLCQHSSRQPRGGRAEKAPAELSVVRRHREACVQSKPSHSQGHKFKLPTAVSLTKTDSPQADHDL